MRLFWVFLCLFCFLLGDACKDIKLFSQAQKQVIAYAYNYGKKYDLGYTMAAIAWKESCAGLYRINFDDPSAGIYHAHLPNVIKRHYAKDTPFRRNAIAEKLISDPEFASKIALEELLYWQKIREGNWKNIIKSYNKGFSWEKNERRNQIANAYYEDISQKVKILKEYFANLPKNPKNKTKNKANFKLLEER